ncbi:MAG: NAAT family transporter [Betaproteobacteria bacterium]|nr:NAAT family transporter [Betaproteobacteria bacterium]
MSHWDALFKTLVALFAIVNPVGAIPIFLSTTDSSTPAEKARIATTVSITVFIVLSVAALIGTSVLGFFGIGIPSFQVGGGILLLLLAVSMMHARESGIRQTREESEEAASREAVAVVPLAVPLLAGPGAISTMIIASHRVPGLGYHLGLVIPAAVVAAIIWITLRVATRLEHRLGKTGMNIVTRLMGLVIAAIAVEFMARGLQELFPSLAG